MFAEIENEGKPGRAEKASVKNIRGVFRGWESFKVLQKGFKIET